MTTITGPGARHWHVIESGAGFVPEADPHVGTDPDEALDVYAHAIKDWADTHPDRPDATYAEAITEISCTCRRGERSADHHDTMTAVRTGRSLAERLGDRVIELVPCRDTRCLATRPDGWRSHR